ncbi:hypothetical protein SAMN05216376_10386 [Mameliella alba]|uniref:3'-5' exoribonuclease domain-containing protein n=1 Tax=Mameliella alba TaxID=561184 RepID=UPI00088310DE|nr:3'-5' exoribonuclease [Mameliella alba]OWV48987.1 exonuclease [Mameliella alba]PTR41034.1 hypothetical protein LX94_01489 [Mameliella alba]GGF48287.1 hypothetical protein GCM10011319_07450 [Mameliella alba]SDC56137.1 hypothetical protein SAMN05216376_10386 [Mameliella alba]
MTTKRSIDAYFSADVETDGPVPGPYSMLSFGMVYAGEFDGHEFIHPSHLDISFYREVRPISDNFVGEALDVNKLDRDKLKSKGADPHEAMTEAARWVQSVANGRNPVLVAYPLAFDWTWLYWYFTVFSESGSPFGYSQCYDLKTAFATKAELPISLSGRSRLPIDVKSLRRHTHHAVDDAVEQAEIFANLFEWRRRRERN